MQRFSRGRRLRAVVVTLLIAAPLVGINASAVSAASQTNTSACQNSATGTFTDIGIQLTGAGSPNPATTSDMVTVSGGQFDALFPAAVLVAGYNLGLLTIGVNDIPGTLDITLNATNTAEGSQTITGVEILGQTEIFDVDGTPGNGDESATDLAISVSFPDTVWTPTGGDIEISDGGTVILASVFNGLIKVTFTCNPGASFRSDPGEDGVLGTEDDVGGSDGGACVTEAGVDCNTFAASSAAPFDTIVVPGVSPTTTTVEPTTTTTTTTTTVAPTTTTTVPAGPNTMVYATECSNTVTSDTSEISFSVTSEVDSPVAPGEDLVVGETLTLAGQTWSVTVPGSVFDAGINLLVIAPGDTVTAELEVEVLATNTDEGSQTAAEIPISILVSLGDNDMANDVTVEFPVPNMTFTASGGAVELTMGAVDMDVDVGLPLPIGFSCSPVSGQGPFYPAQDPTTTTTTVAGPTTTTTEAPTTTTTLAPAEGPNGLRYGTECFNNATPDPSSFSFLVTADIDTVDNTITLSNQRWSATISGTTFDAGIALGLVSEGQIITADVDVRVNATNTTESSQSAFDRPISITVVLNDEGNATTATASFSVPDMVFTKVADPVTFTMGSVLLDVDIGLALPITFDCGVTSGGAFFNSLDSNVGGALALTGASGNVLLFAAGALILLDFGYMALSAALPTRRRHEEQQA